MPNEHGQANQPNEADSHNPLLSAESAGGKIVRYRSQVPSTSTKTSPKMFFLTRIIPLLLAVASGYAAGLISMRGAIDSMHLEIKALRQFKRKAEASPETREFSCSQLAAALGSGSNDVYTDIKKSCMSAPK